MEEIKFKFNIKDKYEKICLQNHQIEHNEILQEKLSKFPLCCDFSAMGSGKSFVSSYIALNSPLNFKHVIVIGPLSIENDWKKKQSVYGVPVRAFISYSSSGSVKGQIDLKHGFLKRTDSMRSMSYNGTKINVDIVDFECTEKYMTYVKEGLLLIIDEIQNIKNVNSRFKACQELINGIVQNCDYMSPPVNNSRVLLLSGTPFDKQEQIPHFFRLSHITKHEQLSEYNLMKNVNIWKGFKDIINVCRHINNKHIEENLYLYENTGTNKQIIPLCFSFFQKIIKPAISHSMPPVQLVAQVVKNNAFYSIINEEDRQLMVDGVTKLKNCLGFSDRNREITFVAGVTLQAVQNCLQMIETAKIKTIANIVRNKLKESEFNKVVVCLNYTNPLLDLAKDLHEFNPLVINGATKVADRGKMVDLFQMSDARYRLIIGNIAVISEGINLDDQDGSFPRFCIVNPNYSTIKICQLSDRFKRTLTLSDSVVHFMYAKHCCEINVLDALARKSQVMKETTPEQVEGGAKFPCDYEMFVEKNDEPVSDVILSKLSLL